MADVQRTINAIEDYIGGNVEGVETVDRMGLTRRHPRRGYQA